MRVACLTSQINSSTNNGFLSANILEDQAHWRDKTKELSDLVIVNNARVVDGWMKVLGRTCSIKDRFLDASEITLYFLLSQHW